MVPHCDRLSIILRKKEVQQSGKELCGNFVTIGHYLMQNGPSPVLLVSAINEWGRDDHLGLDKCKAIRELENIVLDEK